VAGTKLALTPSDAASVRLSAQDRREQLLTVAVDLFSRKGFSGTTTREIATAAGVTEAIIFRHFRTKEQLYTAIIDQRFKSPGAEAWKAEMRSAMQKDDDEAVFRFLIEAIICTHKDDPKFERLMIYAALEGNEIALLYMRHVTASVVDAIRAYILRRQRQGKLRAMTPDTALAAIAGMAQYYALNKYAYGLKEERISDDEAIESFTRIAVSGLQTKGPARKKKP
jgi:TetR/AcrR family transcriptional regulator